MERSNETRLAVMETDIKYIKEGQDDIKQMVKDLVAIKTSVTIYKRLTWGTLTIMLAAFVKSLIPS